MYDVVESFVSINGEGPHAGEPAIFIRFKGCNLNCIYCDTKWANCADVQSEKMSAEELCVLVRNTGIRNATLTGGEPLLQDGIKELIESLAVQGCRVEIETNGSILIKDLADSEHRPVFTMDYKLPSSEMEETMCTENFKYLGIHDSVKFVSGSIADLERAREIIKKYSLIKKCHIFISPVFGKIDPAEIVDFMIKNKMNYVRLQLQLHKFIWDPTRRGV